LDQYLVLYYYHLWIYIGSIFGSILLYILLLDAF
jgi:hypothetical protein